MKSSWRIRTKRKLITGDEGKVSWLQLIGFLLILASIFYLVSNMLFLRINAGEVAIIFFDIMIGIAFAFPDMLKDNNHRVSTMRIVAFMIVNVICMLLLKIGWDKTNFKDIGIDSNWVLIIAFVFAAKAAQSFFERRAAGTGAANNRLDITEDEKEPRDIKPGINRGDAKRAIDANNKDLIKDHPNIKRLIASYYSDGSNRIPCVDIFLTDNAKQNIPSRLEYKDADGKTVAVKTRIIANFRNVKPHVGRGNTIANDDTRSFPGTACCVLEGHEPGLSYLLTCNHVMTGGKFENPGKVGAKAVRLFFGDEFDDIGIWEFGKMDDKVDAALINIQKTEKTEPNDINPAIYTVSDDDCSHTEIEFKGAFSKTKRAFIIHINQPIEIDYKNKTVEVTNLITLSVDLNHFNFTPPTRKGDSGALVYHANSRQPIGMVLGANSQFSFVIPFQTIIDSFPDLQLSLSNA